MAANIPKALIGTYSEKALARNATHVVVDVTKIDF